MNQKSDSRGMTASVALLLTVLSAPFFFSCDSSCETCLKPAPSEVVPARILTPEASPEPLAHLLSLTPFGLDQVREVWSAVCSSAANGYDEEYPFSLLLTSPGTGVGDGIAGKTRSLSDASPLADLLLEKAEESLSTRSGDFQKELAASDLQIYWPYSENWDGKTMPVITFNPENGQDRVKAFRRIEGEDGSVSVEEFFIDEDFAMKNPVWVVNRNEDSGYLSAELFSSLSADKVGTRSVSDDVKTLKLKDLKAHRNYDTWLAGASEFVIKCGSLENFKAETMDDLKNYSVSMTDFVVVIKRKNIGYPVRLNSILVSEWTDQLVNAGFIMIEDDGGARTSWKCTVVAKVKSKSTGFEIDLPYRKSDDIVWRGTLSRSYMESVHNTPIRLGDVSITFTLD